MATQYEYTPSSDNLVTYRQPSDNSNGNFLDNDGKTLLTCEHANRVLSKTDLTSGERTVIASEFGGSPLTSPNDGSPQRSPTAFLRWQGLRLFWAVIVSRRTGHIYFTDRKCTAALSPAFFERPKSCCTADYGTMEALGHGKPSEQEAHRVYRVDAGSGELSPIEDSFVRPNGLCFNQHENLM